MSITVTATEFKTRLGYYFDLLAENNTILITKNGKLIGKLTNPSISNVDAITGILEGRIPASYDRHSIREDRLNEYESLH